MQTADGKYVVVLSHSNLPALLKNVNSTLSNNTNYRPLGGVTLGVDGKYYITLYDEVTRNMDIIKGAIG